MTYTNRPGADRQDTRKRFRPQPGDGGRAARGQGGERTVPHAPDPFGFMVVPFDMV
jgi:hypothetical protein